MVAISIHRRSEGKASVTVEKAQRWDDKAALNPAQHWDAPRGGAAHLTVDSTSPSSNAFTNVLLSAEQERTVSVLPSRNSRVMDAS